MSQWILGIDASLTRTALVMIPLKWMIGDWSALHVHEIDVRGMPMEECADAREFEEYRVDRLQVIATKAVDFVWNVAVKQQAHIEIGRAFIESYAFSASSASVTKLAELGGVLRVEFYRRLDIVLEPVSSTSWRKLLLGKLPRAGQKEAAHAALYRAGFLRERRKPELGPERAATRWVKDCGDAADAFGVSNWGRAECELPFLTLA